jgi:hypothetical protein
MSDDADVAHARLALIVAATNFSEKAGVDEAVKQLACILLSIAGGESVDLKPTVLHVDGINAMMMFGPSK